MKKDTYLIALSVVILLGIGLYSFSKKTDQTVFDKTALMAKFNTLSQGGNSSCSASFTQSIDNMPAGSRMQGSCCSPMNFDRYSEQVEGLRKFKDIPEIPPDPYDIDAALAQKLKSYYDMKLSPDGQQEYDYAMEHSHEKGPCCCKCWRYYSNFYDICVAVYDDGSRWLRGGRTIFRWRKCQ